MVLALFLSAAQALAAGSPEVQLCLQHLKSGEREKAEKALGPLEELPLYRVQLEVDPAKREVKGRVEVEVLARKRTISELFLRVTPNASGRKVTLSDAKVAGQPVAMERPEPTLIRVPVDPPVESGGRVKLEVSLQASVPKAKANAGSLLGALGASGPPGDYGAFSAAPDFLSLVGIVPMLPPLNADGTPWAGPSGIGDLALYEPSNVLATVTVPSGWQVHATGVAMGEVPEKTQGVRFSYAAALVRDFPVFVSQGYQSTSKTVGGVTVESFYASKDAAVGKRVLQYTASALETFESKLGALPYKHFRVVEAPLSDGAGGMEFQGLITVGTSLYRGAADPNSIFEGSGLEMFKDMMQQMSAMGVGGPGGKDPFQHITKTLERTVEFTVAHEVGHQYFAGLVGTDPIQEPVADEALTQYAAVLYFEWAHGRGRVPAAGGAGGCLPDAPDDGRRGRPGPAAHRRVRQLHGVRRHRLRQGAPLLPLRAQAGGGHGLLQGPALVRGHLPVQVGLPGLLPQGAGQGEPRQRLLAGAPPEPLVEGGPRRRGPGGHGPQRPDGRQHGGHEARRGHPEADGGDAQGPLGPVVLRLSRTAPSRSRAARSGAGRRSSRRRPPRAPESSARR
jgi:hypothetical protein